MDKLTLKCCRRLLKEHWAAVSHGMDDGGEMNAEILKGVLEQASPDSRFRVSYDDGEDPSWDLDGPGVRYGEIWWDDRRDAEAGRDALNRILRAHFGPSTRRVEHTPEAHMARCVLEGNCCPACGSNDLSLEDYRHGSATLTAARSCGFCNSEWDEVYTLQGYQNLKTD